MTDAAETADRILGEVRQALSASDEERDDRLRELADEAATFVDETTTEELIKAVGLTDDDGDHVETIPHALAAGGEESVLDLKTILALSKAGNVEDGDAMSELRERLSDLTAESEPTAESETTGEGDSEDETETGDAADSEATDEAEAEEAEAEEADDDGSPLTKSLQSQLDKAADSLKASVEQMQTGDEADDSAASDEAEVEEEEASEDDAEDDGLVDVGDDDRSRGRPTMHSTVPSARPDMNGVVRHSTVPRR
ncbi:hypothetical protein [Haloprofundus salilacus]|uniref:hypothetical protein n=1 Tax=Haloprofundus salilacus TaxID=2876190 RepID=UPI001CCCDEF9|nr:hypothetical protein [Haloprofundus salilacus]